MTRRTEKPALDPGSWVWPDGDSPVRPAMAGYLRDTVHLSLSLPPPDPAKADLLRTLIKTAAAADPRATLACYASPFVGTPIRVYAHRRSWPIFEDAIRERYRDAVPHLLLELAARGLLPPGQAPAWTAGAPPLTSPFTGVTIHPPTRATGWEFQNGTLTPFVEGKRGPSLSLSADMDPSDPLPGGARCERAYVRLSADIKLALTDANPLAALEDHPERPGNQIDLGGKPIDAWQTTFRTALQMISLAAPEIFLEMKTTLTTVVPIGFQPERHFSSTYREALGSIYASLHPQACIVAEALIHEFQHNKLHLARRHDPILHNALHPLYRSPVRPDPRPLWGILLAAHAFLAVARFQRILLRQGHPEASKPDFSRRLYETDCKNFEAMATLRKHARWTDFGRSLFRRLDNLNQRHVTEWAERGVFIRPTAAHED